jgi:acyl transferase domain-containing protein
MDPQMRMLHEVVYEAIVDAGVSRLLIHIHRTGINPSALRGSRTGVFVSSAVSETAGALTQVSSVLPRRHAHAGRGYRRRVHVDWMYPSYVCQSSVVLLRFARSIVLC